MNGIASTVTFPFRGAALAVNLAFGCLIGARSARPAREYPEVVARDDGRGVRERVRAALAG